MNKRTGIKGFLTTAMAFAAAAQAGIARDIASVKGGFNRKGHGKKSGGKRSGRPYEWGTLGVSQVTEEMQKQEGIMSRRDRREMARFYNEQFTPIYNGPVIRVNGGSRK